MARHQDSQPIYNRRPGVVYDQHRFPGHPLFADGRPWSVEIDNKTGMPVGPFQPKGWNAPWLPPQGAKIFKSDLNQPGRVTIVYEELLAERVAAHDEFQADRERAALARGWNPNDPEKQEQLDKIVGSRRGLQPAEVIVACMQGDPWILGASEKVNRKVEVFIPKKKSRTETLMARFGDLTDDGEDEPQSLAEDLEAQMDYEEEFDAEGLGGGKVVPPAPKKKGKVKELLEKAGITT